MLAAAASPLLGVTSCRDSGRTDACRHITDDRRRRRATGPVHARRRRRPRHAAGSCPALLQRTFNRLQTGKPESLCQFDGKVLLVVNTASYCGYTHQFEGLEAMYRKYKDRGLVVVGFPSNDFGKQEPGTNAEIAEFCRLTYGVEFPMFEKSSVTNIASNPLFTELASQHGQVAAVELPQVRHRSQRPARRELHEPGRARRPQRSSRWSSACSPSVQRKS